MFTIHIITFSSKNHLSILEVLLIKKKAIDGRPLLQDLVRTEPGYCGCALKLSRKTPLKMKLLLQKYLSCKIV